MLLKHQTRTQFLKRLREDYKTSSGEKLITLSKFIVNNIRNGNFTEYELMTEMGYTELEWESLKLRVVDRLTAADIINTATGE